jgi:16S rRNA (guanine527-N7)-methyltransferase
LTEVERILGPIVNREAAVPAGWAREMDRFLELVRARNRRVNLVSRRSIDRLVEGQLLPSLAGLLVIPRGSFMRVLDVGSGGGFPGIPLKILRPTIRLDLLDATRKKTDFLEAAVRELGLTDTAVHWGRIERPPVSLSRRSPFDVVLARAVGDDDAIRQSAPSIAPGGALWVFDDPSSSELVLSHPALGNVTALRALS